MADGTKTVVDTPAEDEAVVATAFEEQQADEPIEVTGVHEVPGETEVAEETKPIEVTEVHEVTTETSKEEPAGDQPGEVTAPLSKAELAAELGTPPATERRSARRPAVEPPVGNAAGPHDRPVTSTETLDADTGTLPAALPAPAHHSGDLIAGRYRLEECTTQAESFSSWRAVDEKLRRAVGIHLLSAGNRRAKAVLTAARSAAPLNDVRFVQVLDAVQIGDLVYVVREWLPGASDLTTLLADGPMEPYDAYQMVRQVSEAIASAHQRGQAHLRLTPRCVLRTDGGQYRINGIAVDAALRGLPVEDAELTDTRAIGALLYAALTHRWPYPEDRYDLKGLPKDLGCVPPDQVKAGVHKVLSELAARILCEHPPHHQEPITTPEQLAKAIALMPKIRQPEPPAPPAFERPRRTSPTAPTQQLRPVDPSPEPTPWAAPRTSGRRRGLRQAVKLTAALVALAAIGVGSWQLVHQLNSGRRPSPAQTVTVQATAPGAPHQTAGNKLAVASLLPFNAFGDDKTGHSSELTTLVAGKPDALWTTQGYHDPFGGGYRKGTGFLVDLGSAKPVSSVELQCIGLHSVELHAAPADATTAPSADEAGFNSLLPTAASGSGTQITLTPGKPLTTRYLLIWLTGIPKDSDGKFRGKVSEISVYG